MAVAFLMLLVVATGANAATRAPLGSSLVSRFDGARTATWHEGGTYGPWQVTFNGYGAVTRRAATKALHLRPAAAARADRTHAALVTTKTTYRDLDVAATLATPRQLRTGSAPNTWERGWFLWHYTDTTHFYYVVLKENGWEIGKADPAYPGAQRFLATGNSPTYPLGRRARVSIRQRGTTFTVTADGRPLATFTDTERPYRSGSLGLYTEDAEAVFDDIVAIGR